MGRNIIGIKILTQPTKQEILLDKNRNDDELVGPDCPCPFHPTVHVWKKCYDNPEREK